MKKKEYKIQIHKKFGLNLKRVSGPALHKYAPDIYIIYVWTYCVLWTYCVSRTKQKADIVEW